MKRSTIFKSLIFSFLLCLCLAGCMQKADTSSEQESSAAESTLTDFPGDTVPENPLTESQTDPSAEDPVMNADQVYQDDSLTVLDLGLDACSNDVNILPLGNHLLIATSPIQEWGDAAIDTSMRTVHLRIYDPVTGVSLHETDISAPGANAVWVTIAANGLIAVPSADHQYIQFLDETLTIRSSIDVPDFTVEGIPSESIMLQPDPDFQYGYFSLFPSHQIYKIKLETGEASVLYTGTSDISLDFILFDGRVLSISEYGNGSVYQRFISTEDGSELAHTTSYTTVYTQGDNYYALLEDDTLKGRLIYGSVASKRFYHTMILESAYPWYNFRIDRETGTMIHYVTNDQGASLQCYDLSGGTLTARNDLSAWLGEDTYDLYSVCSGITEAHQYYSLMIDYEKQFTRLILWNPYGEPKVLDTFSEIPVINSAGNNHAEELPLNEAYQEVRRQADQLETAYHVDIKIAEECSTLDPCDYVCSYLTDIPAIQSALSSLQECLTSYPEGFFAQLESDTYPNGLVIYLCSTLTGTQDNTLTTAGGLTYTRALEHVMALDCTYGLNIWDFHHEMSHVIDNHIFSLCYDENQPDAFSDQTWSALNPTDFSYTLDYSTYSELDDSDTSFHILDADSTDKIYFIDTYSKVSPTEDRARIFENAVYGGESFLGSDCPHIREKLAYMSRYIRYHFDTEGWPAVTRWETALQ